MPHRALGVIVMVAMSMSWVTAGASAAQPTHGGLAWRSCGDRFECATLDVPVDYTAPQGEQVGIAVIRRGATNPNARIGSLVVNYGGPGNPGTETLRRAYLALPSEVRERFDIVSFDPRGTGSSRPIDCVDDATFERASSEDVTPDSEQELPSFYDGSAFSTDLVGACIAKNGSWLARVGSRNVTRDLDRLRAALGDARLTYLGYSYGSVIGALFAEDFPNHIRAVVLDSPVNLSSTPQGRQRGNAAGFEGALDAFLASCADDPTCAFHSDGNPRGALLRLRDELEAGLTLAAVDGRRVGVSELYVGMLQALYARELWPTLARALQDAAEARDGDGLQRLADALLGRRDDGTYDSLQESIGMISCADDPAPRVSFAEFRATFEELSREFPVFGAAFGGSPVGCDARLPRPTAGELLGDVRATHAPPVLIVGVTNDPATPYQGARNLHRRIKRSHLLTLESTQHTAFGRGISCIDGAVDRYLLTRALPPPRTRCTR